MNIMHRDHQALLRRIALVGATGMLVFQRRDEPTVKSVADAIDKIGSAFAEYQKTNDARIEAATKGAGTAELDAKLARMDAVINDLSEQKSKLEKLDAKLRRPGVLSGNSAEPASPEEVEHKTAFLSWMRSPSDAERRQKLTAAQRVVEEKAKLEGRAAAVVTGTGAAGGFALPLQIEQQIASIGLDISPIRQIATVRTVGTPDYKELFDLNGSGFEWIGETDVRNQTNTSNLAEVSPTFGMASAKPQATEESIDDLFFNVETWVVNSAAAAIAQGEGAAFVLGDGVKKPTGFLAGPAPVVTDDTTRAFGTLEYVASGLAAAMPASSDTFYDLVYAIRARYRANARWVTAKALLSVLRKYKTTTGEYLWQPALAMAQPATFMGYPITEAEDMPIVAANSFPLAFGDFREGYLIADRAGMRITRDEITTPGYVKFYIRKRVGGILRNTQAIKLLKIALA
jgi:HK97 family phage major capsid protein